MGWFKKIASVASGGISDLFSGDPVGSGSVQLLQDALPENTFAQKMVPSLLLPAEAGLKDVGEIWEKGGSAGDVFAQTFERMADPTNTVNQAFKGIGEQLPAGIRSYLPAIGGIVGGVAGGPGFAALGAGVGSHMAGKDSQESMQSAGTAATLSWLLGGKVPGGDATTSSSTLAGESFNPAETGMDITTPVAGESFNPAETTIQPFSEAPVNTSQMYEPTSADAWAKALENPELTQPVQELPATELTGPAAEAKPSFTENMQEIVKEAQTAQPGTETTPTAIPGGNGEPIPAPGTPGTPTIAPGTPVAEGSWLTALGEKIGVAPEKTTQFTSFITDMFGNGNGGGGKVATGNGGGTGLGGWTMPLMMLGGMGLNYLGGKKTAEREEGANKAMQDSISKYFEDYQKAKEEGTWTDAKRDAYRTAMMGEISNYLSGQERSAAAQGAASGRGGGFYGSRLERAQETAAEKLAQGMGKTYEPQYIAPPSVDAYTAMAKAKSPVTSPEETALIGGGGMMGQMPYWLLLANMMGGGRT